MVSDLPAKRNLTLHERWFLMRRNTGYQFTITVLVSYPISALPSHEQIRQRAFELQDHFAQLNCCLRDTKTRQPYWEQLLNRSEVVNPQRLGNGEKVLLEEQRRMDQEDFDGRPLWQVTPYVCPDKAYLAISALHEMIDGRGLLRLVHYLLARTELPNENLDIPTYPDTVDLRPSWTFLLPFALQEKVYPWLPRFITSRLTAPVWPVGLVRVNPLDLPGRIILLHLPSDLVDLLKSLGRFHGVPTLTPTLFTAWLVAMGTVTKGTLAASIAVDERKPELGHSVCTGLYHASHLYPLQLPSTFWNTARNVALHIAHPSSLTIARMRMGMIAWVPDGPVGSRDPKRPTAWEDWQLQRNESLNPYVCSASFSNLGRIDLPDGADGLVVASSPSVGDPPIKLVLTGTTEGITVAVTFRHGDILTEEQVGEMGATWLELLWRLVRGTGEDIDLNETFEVGTGEAIGAREVE